MLSKFAAAVLLLLSASAGAQTQGPFGLGVVLIEPTGISGNYYYEKQKSLSAGLGWGSSHLRLNLDHLWYRPNLFVIDRIPIDIYFGVGARFHQRERRNGDNESEIGVRGPVGVSYHFRKVPIQVFAELAPALIVVDESAFVVDLALGGRYYF